MNFLRLAWSKIWLLLLAALICGAFNEAKSLHEIIAYKVAPGYEYSAEDLRMKALERECEERNRARNATTICWFPIGKEAYSYEAEYIKPMLKMLNEASGAVVSLLLAAAILRFAWHSVTTAWALILRKLPPDLSGRASQGAHAAAGGIWGRIQARRAERQFLRYHRLYQGGLLSEAEFEAKKRELKPKILG